MAVAGLKPSARHDGMRAAAAASCCPGRPWRKPAAPIPEPWWNWRRCRQGAGTMLRLCLRRRSRADRLPSLGRAEQALAAPAEPDGDTLRLPARDMEALAAVAPFADWGAPAGLWRRGVCFSPGEWRPADRRGRPAAGLCAGAGAAAVASSCRWVRCGCCCIPTSSVTRIRSPCRGAARIRGSCSAPGTTCWSRPSCRSGPWGKDIRLREDSAAVAGRRVLLDAVWRERLLGWLRALPDPRAPVKLEWLAGGLLAVSQSGAGGGDARLELPVGCHGARSPSCLPPLVLPPRDLAAAVTLGNSLGVAVARGGRVSLCCHGAGGAFCQVDSLVRVAGGGRAAGGSGRRPAA